MDHPILQGMVQYTPVKVLARTNFSTTVLAKHNASGDEHVIKMCKTDGVSDHTKSLVEQEATLLKSLNHPNIIKCIDSFTRDNYVVVITEYANVGDLQSQILYAKEHVNTPTERQFLNQTIINLIFGQICRAIQYIHSMKIIHRDIKPSNILLHKPKNSKLVIAKIADFGVSRILRDDQYANTMIGTADYSAPEVLAGKPYNQSCDIWGCGMILYEMTNLKFPFKRLNFYKPEPFIIETNPFTQPEQKLLIENMITLEPERRISAENILAFPGLKKLLERCDQMY
ncbi:Kinase [Hexamita inflata]|uniref:non-specific serine/threonine protein kinase n=1 Tax=Hexamita inflata TaxID=28002 RepID=A0AA86PVN2_9EUKA|nr:Kinase [Hexamita inflata]